MARKPLLGLCGALVLLIGALDRATGSELDLSILWVLPVYLAASRGGTVLGFAVAVLCAAAGFLANVLGNDPQAPPLIAAGNAAAAFGLFALVVLGLAHLRSERAEQERLVQRLRHVLAEREAVQVQLARKAEELVRSNEELEQYAYAAAHDLRSPLVTIGGYVRLVRRKYEDDLCEEARSYLDHAFEGVQRLQSLIEDLLEYSRLGSEQVAFEPVECASVLDRVEADLRRELDSAGAVLTRGPLPRVRGRTAQLLQLFQNLVGNAVKFRGVEAPRIHVTAARQGSWWVFAVGDNGIGFAPEEAERVFGLFQRLPTGRQIPGTGIGLAICRKIVESHGGRIWAESAAGAGATFRFTLPADDQPGSEPLTGSSFQPRRPPA